MRVLILTTATPHHIHFVRQLASMDLQLHVIEETTGIVAPFETAHAFEDDRNAHEWSYWFGGRECRLADFAATTGVENVNSDQAVRLASGWRPEVAVVFGTRRLKPRTIAALGPHPLNLHGGDPEAYRGLDTHLWAIYHRDFPALVTTLHYVNETLDDGAVVDTQSLAIEPRMPLAHLRRVNTDACVALAGRAIGCLAETGAIPSRGQSAQGRYYSFMPAVLKTICLQSFEAYTGTL